MRVASVINTIIVPMPAMHAKTFERIAAFDFVSRGLRVSLLSSTLSESSVSFISVRFKLLV